MSKPMTKNGSENSEGLEGIKIGEDHPLADAVGSFRDEDSQAWLDAVMEHIREQRLLDRETAEEESSVSS